MRFTEAGVAGAYVVDTDPIADDRGSFARAFDAREFEAHGLDPFNAQTNMSTNHRKGTLRGMHFQAPPHQESKFLRCLRGAVYDVIVDLRPDSPTYLRHFGVELSAANGRAIYVPGTLVAHAYLALEDDSTVIYQVNEFYTPGVERGVRFDDPVLGIEWPIAVESVSDKDRAWPLIETPANS